MALIDPQTLTFDGNVNSLPLVERIKRSAVYKTSNDALLLAIEHVPTKAGRKQHKVRNVYSKIVDVDDNRRDEVTIYITIDRPLVGFAVDEVVDQVAMIRTWITDAMVAALFADQS